MGYVLYCYHSVTKINKGLVSYSSIRKFSFGTYKYLYARKIYTVSAFTNRHPVLYLISLPPPPHSLSPTPYITQQLIIFLSIYYIYLPLIKIQFKKSFTLHRKSRLCLAPPSRPVPSANNYSNTVGGGIVQVVFRLQTSTLIFVRFEIIIHKMYNLETFLVYRLEGEREGEITYMNKCKCE